MLYIIGGLPGTGKTTVSQAFASKHQAVHLRIDIIEQALRESGMTIRGPEGYIIAYRLAEHNLRLGLDVVADSVNPWKLTRSAWRDVAARAGVPFVEVEFICSDTAEHRRRVEARTPDIAGFKLPTWEEVENRDYEYWTTDHIVVDTAGQTVEESLSTLERLLQAQ